MARHMPGPFAYLAEEAVENNSTRPALRRRIRRGTRGADAAINPRQPSVSLTTVGRLEDGRRRLPGRGAAVSATRHRKEGDRMSAVEVITRQPAMTGRRSAAAPKAPMSRGHRSRQRSASQRATPLPPRASSRKSSQHADAREKFIPVTRAALMERLTRPQSWRGQQGAGGAPTSFDISITGARRATPPT